MSTPRPVRGFTPSDTHDGAADAGPPDPNGDRVIDRRKVGQKRGILIHLKYISDETVETPGPHVRY